MNLPKNQRRPLPQPPKMLEDIPISGRLFLLLTYIGMSGAKMQQYNEEAFKDWNEKALVPCEH